MEMPKPTADHKKLEKLAGIWQGTETVYPSQWDPKGGKADGTTRSRIALTGFAIISDYEQTRGGQRTYEGHGVYTWDARANQVVLHWYDAMGQGCEEFRGTWKGDVLPLASKTPMGHARITYDLSKPGVMGSLMEMSQDGAKWTKVFDGSYKRKD
ncbi:MAG TPA: DUF1579 family protein [Planctomycetota bacterium]|nr:DUF1579 family protein [Planctomycetota bacterium]